MDFTFVEFPATVNFNTFKSYFDLHKCKLPRIHGETLNLPGIENVNIKQIKSLRHLVLDSLLENWRDNPIFKEIERQEDRNYVLSNLNVNLPLKILSSYIQDDFFWRKSYQHRWKTLYYMMYTYQSRITIPCATTPLLFVNSEEKENKRGKTKPWINIYMERHLQEFIENVTTTDYEQESVQATLDICAMYINQLEINYLQPSMDGHNDHIPLDFILRNLPELHTLRLTYCTKTIGAHYYLGCNMLTRRDASLLARGLQQCHELVNFCLHSTKLEPYQLELLAHSLDKGCHYLSALSLEHCSLGDEGIRQFLNSCNKESFVTLKYLDLTNNKISVKSVDMNWPLRSCNLTILDDLCADKPATIDHLGSDIRRIIEKLRLGVLKRYWTASEGAYILSKVLKNLSLEKLILRLNPIGSEGASSIFSALEFLPILNLDISGCSLDQTLTKLYMQLVVQNKILLAIDVSNNNLGTNFGKHLYKVIGFNKTLKTMNLRNTGVTLEMFAKIQAILKNNDYKNINNGI